MLSHRSPGGQHAGSRWQGCLLMLITALVAGHPLVVAAATAPPLGALRQFGVLGGSAVTGAGGLGVIVSGDVGSSPTATITNFPPSSVAAGFTLHMTNDATVQQARAAATATSLDLASQGPGVALGAQLNGQILSAGSYSFSAAADLAASGTLTLNGPGVFVFNVTSALTANLGSTFLGSADPCSVFWRVGTDATLNGTSFFGTVITDTGIVTLGSGANATGRLVAATAVTMPGGGGNTVGGCSQQPIMTLLKSAQTFSDPINLMTNPKAIPGAFVTYSMTVMNSGGGSVDGGTTVISDPIPANTAMFVGDIGAVGSGPVLFSQGAASSGLTFTYTALGNILDDVDFSSDGGASWNYAPTPGATGCDPLVTNVRIKPKGVFVGSVSAPSPSVTASFRVCVK